MLKDNHQIVGKSLYESGAGNYKMIKHNILKGNLRSLNMIMMEHLIISPGIFDNKRLINLDVMNLHLIIND